MLPLGRIGIRAERGNDGVSSLTHDERRTMITMWAIARSPLMFGGDLATLDPFTRGLLSS
jgi:alpha-galactosidase